MPRRVRAHIGAIEAQITTREGEIAATRQFRGAQDTISGTSRSTHEEARERNDGLRPPRHCQKRDVVARGLRAGERVNLGNHGFRHFAE